MTIEVENIVSELMISFALRLAGQRKEREMSDSLTITDYLSTPGEILA